MTLNKDVMGKVCMVLVAAAALYVLVDMLYETDAEAAAATARRRLERRIGKLASEKSAVSIKAAIDIANLGPAGEPAVDALIELLSRDVAGEDPAERASVRRHAMYALGKIGPAAEDAIEPVGEILREDDPVMRVWAAIALLRIDPEGEPRVDVMIDVLENHADISVRSNAIGGIELVGDRAKAAVPALIGQLGDSELRRHAARALGCIGPGASEAIGPLTKLLKKLDPVQGRRRDEAAIEAIEEALGRIKS